MAENGFLPIIEEEEIEIIDDDFYEKIQAPKFVDLTAPDKRRLDDDRHWFCARFGCDQKHEEELDSEAIYKDFVLRVMAARSPNVRLRKAMNRRQREASSNLKSPNTAPAKPRMSRMAFISSLSHKVTDNNVKVVKPLSKVSATPNAKVKQSSSVAKALTTPRNQKKVSNLEQFRSVQNKKSLTVVVPKAKSRVLAKTLNFNSPKKVIGIKNSVELKSSMKALCSAMKKLEFNGVKKNGEGCNNSLPVDSSRKKQFKGREVKSRVFDSLYSSNRKKPETNDVRCLKEKKMKAMQKHKVPVQHESDSSDDITSLSEEKSIDSLERGESSVLALSEASRDDITSLSSSNNEEKKTIEESEKASRDDITSRPCSSEEEKTTFEESENEEKRITVSDKGKFLKAKKRKVGENSMVYDDKENEIDLNENDDKENSSVPSENIRSMSINSDGSKKAILGSKQEDKKIHKKSALTTTDSQVIKYRKLKPTNPKPFKFRTDERGILKEANLEKKITAPLKEATAKDGKAAIRKNNNKKETCTAQSDQDNYSSCSEKSHRTTQQNQTGNIHSDNNSNSKVQHKLSAKTPNRNPGPKLNVVRPLSVLSRKKEKVVLASACKPVVIVEKTPEIVKPKETAKPRKNDASCSQGKRTLTVPKEPKFHSLHVPKSCITRGSHI
ncbi:hypothetical protein L195_g007642 [Trifolium pratense]|uniref:Uncharacterized protein n=1 Tax=Trifolium pratense TaxID=57577 RepID=A0A2K3P6Y4_TRIPR|nr:hypothetical protein L195_g007642 [Trifolium pratense]